MISVNSMKRFTNETVMSVVSSW